MRFKQQGFTIIEMAVVLSITATLAVASIVFYSGLKSKSVLNEARNSISTALQDSRNRALAGFGTNSQGVNIQSGQVTYFQGTTYTGSGTAIALPPNVTVSPSNTTIIFTRISGQPSVTPTITITNSRGATAKVSVDGAGAVTEQ